MNSATGKLYSLRAAANAVYASGSRRSPTRILQEQIENRFSTLRFGRRLEHDFCDYLRMSSMRSRLALLGLILVATLVCPWLDARVLDMPQELLPSARWLSLGLVVPVIVAAVLFGLLREHSRGLEYALAGMFLALVAWVLVQRVVYHFYDFDLPLELVGIITIAMFVMARIRFRVMAPIAVLAFLVVLAVEVVVVRPDSNAYAHLIATSFLFVLALSCGYSTEYFIRWTWLNGTLLHYYARTDSLTGLLNRSALDEALVQGQAHARREQLCYAIAMIDIDTFGDYNEQYGHLMGDAALERVADALEAKARRPQDICGRYGGEEFVVMWMDGDKEALCAIAEATRSAVEQAHIAHVTSRVAPWVTISIGLCYVGHDEERVSVEQILGRADRLLYHAKQSGRNRIICAAYRDAPPAAGDRGASEPRSAVG